MSVSQLGVVPQAIAIMHLLLSNKLVQKAATPSDPVAEPAVTNHHGNASSSSSSNSNSAASSVVGPAATRAPPGDSGSKIASNTKPAAVSEGETQLARGGDAGVVDMPSNASAAPADSTSSSMPSKDAPRAGSSRPSDQRKSFLRTVLVLVPKNVLRNWDDELKRVRLA